MAGRKLASAVRVTEPSGRHVVLGAGDDVPDWAAGQIQNPKAWEGDEPAEAEFEASAATPYASMTVADLRGEIKARNEDRDEDTRIATDGNKADLVEALEADDESAE